jgi:hypothetical protein
MDLLYPSAEDNKRSYLKQLLTYFIPKRMINIVQSPSFVHLQQLVAILVFTTAVGLGYLYAAATPDVVEKANS